MLKLKKYDYSIYGNKLYLFTDNEDKDSLKLRKIGSGTEADIYYFNKDILFKIYKRELIDTNPKIYNELRIEEIASKRNILKKSKLLIGPIYINGEFRGCMIHNHRFAPKFNFVKLIPNNDYVINRFIEVADALKELEDNNMCHKDLREENILLPKLKKSELIDLDGKSIIFYGDSKKNYSAEMYDKLFQLILHIIFDVYYDNENELIDESILIYDKLQIYENFIYEAFKSYKIPNSFIEEFSKRDSSYELIYNFLNFLKKDKILDKKLVLK